MPTGAPSRSGCCAAGACDRHQHVVHRHGRVLGLARGDGEEGGALARAFARGRVLLEIHGPLGHEVALDLHAVHGRVRRGLEQLVERERRAGGLAEGRDALRVEGVQREVEEDLGACGALAVQQGVDLRGVGRAGLEGHRRGYRGGHWGDHGRECHPGRLGKTGVGASSLVSEHGCRGGLGGKRDNGRERGDDDRR